MLLLKKIFLQHFFISLPPKFNRTLKMNTGLTGIFSDWKDCFYGEENLCSLQSTKHKSKKGEGWLNLLSILSYFPNQTSECLLVIQIKSYSQTPSRFCTGDDIYTSLIEKTWCISKNNSQVKQSWAQQMYQGKFQGNLTVFCCYKGQLQFNSQPINIAREEALKALSDPYQCFCC